MIKASIGNPYAVFVGVVIVLIFSTLAFRNIPVQLKPTIDQPEIQIETDYTGAGVLEIEDQITNKLERQLASLSNLQEMSSNSQEGVSNITLDFTDSADRGQALLDTVQAVQRTQNLPQQAQTPQIKVVSGATDQAIMFIDVGGDASINVKYDTMDQVVVPALLRVQGVGGVTFFGGAARQIAVQPDIAQMAARGVTVADLSRVLAVENQNVAGGALDEGAREFNVRTMGRYNSLKDITSTVIRHDARGVVTVGDVAKVLDTRALATRFVRANSKRSMLISVNRQSDANSVTTIEGVQRQLATFEKQFKGQGLDIRFQTINSELTYIRKSMDLVQHDLLLGAFLAALVLALFLRAGRPILIVVLSIPISLMTVFLVLELLHRSVNIIVLAGLSFASGMVVDDAIVALENIDRHLKEQGKTPREAAQEGIQEVWGAIVAATLTKIAVFLPLLLNTTEAGLLFKDIAIAIMASIAMSLVVTVTVVPALAALLLKPPGPARSFRERYPGLYVALDLVSLRWFGEAAERAYTRFLDWAVLHKGGATYVGRVALLAGVAVLFLLSLKLLPSASYLPNGSRNFVLAQVQPLVGQRNEVTSQLFKPVEDFAAQDPRVESYFTSAAAPSFSAIGISVKPELATEANLNDIQQKVTDIGRKLPGFQSFVGRRPSIFRIRDKEFTLEIVGPELTQLQRIAAELQRRLAERPDIIVPGTVRSSYVVGVPELAVTPDRLRAAELGVSTADLAQVVESMVAGRKVSTYSEGSNDYDLVVRGDPAVVNNRSALKGLVVTAHPAEGGEQPVRLDEVATVAEDVGPSAVRHFNRQRSIQLTVNTQPGLPTQAALDLAQRQVVAPMNSSLPQGYTVVFGQAADKLRNTLRSLVFQGGLAILIIYLLMVPLFRSFYYPLIVLITVPLAWSGSFLAISLAYRFTNKLVQFDVLGMLGLIIMSGIVVSNAILIIHQMLNFREYGMEPNAALHESARTRLRPIMMTVLAAVLGMAPLALGSGSGSELYRSLGIIVEGGLISSTVFTLLTLPTLMSLVNDVNAKMRGRKRSASS